MTNQEYKNAIGSNKALTNAGSEIMKLLATYDSVAWRAKNELETKLLRVATEVKTRKNEIDPDTYAEFTRRFREVRELVNSNWNALHLEAGDRGLFED